MWQGQGLQSLPSNRAVPRVWRSAGACVTNAANRVVAFLLLAILAPLIVTLALAVRLESDGPAIFRCRRMGLQGREFDMLKFRKMHQRARGMALTAPDDERFTRLGRSLARLKLDEVPQLWNVARGHMCLVGPRPEDPSFVRVHSVAYGLITSVKPGITGLSQLAFARESQILAPNDLLKDYLERLLPLKIELDQLYARERSLRMDLRILMWTIVTIGLRRDVSVDRRTARISIRRRPVSAVSQGVEA